jgi:hypothetical protein
MDNIPVTELAISTSARYNLKITGQWARFIAIVGFVFTGLLVAFGFSFGFMMQAISGGAALQGVPTFLMGMIYLIIGVLYFFPLLFLYRFSRYTKKGLRDMDQPAMDQAFSNLRSHLTFIGIMTAIAIAIYLMAGIIFALVAVFS